MNGVQKALKGETEEEKDACLAVNQPGGGDRIKGEISGEGNYEKKTTEQKREGLWPSESQTKKLILIFEGGRATGKGGT